MFRKWWILAVLNLMCFHAQAEEAATTWKDKVETFRDQGYTVKTITPIFSQLLMLSYPKGFVPAFEGGRNGQYVQESVLEGETINKWSQMITITGAKGLSAIQKVTPALFAVSMAGGFKGACPTSYSALSLGEVKFGGNDGFAAVLSCGTSTFGGSAHSESMLLVVIKGDNDYYTIQWAERGEASATPIKLDNATWSKRLQKLMPIKLCPIVPGEKPPYPSCANNA